MKVYNSPQNCTFEKEKIHTLFFKRCELEAGNGEGVLSRKAR